jgi:catechol 2,3-dioxygenase-like lactoylglutathione lyase family enzyme
MSFHVERVVPVLRIFSIEKAKEFYFGYLGFQLSWEHRFDADAPLYMQIERDGLVLHLSEHYGDGTPGSVFRVEIRGVRELHAELKAKNYGYYRPGLEETPWKTVELTLLDPFGNRLILSEQVTK